MATKYIQGSSVTTRAEFKDSSGALVDPSDVLLKYKLPDDSVVTRTYALSQVTKVSTGIYETFITLLIPGKYNFRWESTGINGSVSESSINVSASQVI